MNNAVQYYKMLLRVIFDGEPIVPQTCKGSDGQIVTSLTSNYLCLQCSTIASEEERIKHGNKKSHRFCEFQPSCASFTFLLLTSCRRRLEKWRAFLPGL